MAESEVEGDLVHSRAAVDLEQIATCPDDTEQDVQKDRRLRIQSLNTWAPEVVVCTIDTVLALPRNNRRGLYASPALLSGSFIFDEVHAYDDEMLAAMIALIQQTPGTPYLLMSASLPIHRRRLLREQLGQIVRVEPPAELEGIPRYRIEMSGLDEAFRQACESVRLGKRVLWVCNLVSRAQALFDRAREAGLPAITYHSRFRYVDRVARHREVVEGFKPAGGGGLLAITTQVAEMSLDLDADLLVTELAPIPALIQRLGRLNRRVDEHDRGTPRIALIVDPEASAPYEHSEVALASTWVERASRLARPISQMDLRDLFSSIADESDERHPSEDLRMPWLDSGWWATPQPVRKPGFNVDVLLAQDAGACRRHRTERIRRALPMPYDRRMERWQELHGVLVAPSRRDSIRQPPRCNMGRLICDLQQPGMTALHQVGLGGLYMTLDAFERTPDVAKRLHDAGIQWTLASRSVELEIDDDHAQRAISALIDHAFQLDGGFFRLPALERGAPQTPEQKILLYQALLGTFLQFGPHRPTEKKRTLVIDVDQNQLRIPGFAPVKRYRHQSAPADLVTKKGRLAERVALTGWLFPGGSLAMSPGAIARAISRNQSITSLAHSPPARSSPTTSRTSAAGSPASPNT